MLGFCPKKNLKKLFDFLAAVADITPVRLIIENRKMGFRKGWTAKTTRGFNKKQREEIRKVRWALANGMNPHNWTIV